MIAGLTGEWIAPGPEDAGEPAVCRPDRRRRSGQRLAALHIAAHVAQPALEAGQEVAQYAESIFRSGERRGLRDVGNRWDRRYDRATGRARLHDGREFLHRTRLHRV